MRLLFILLAATLNVFAHFPIVADTDESRGLISNVDFAPLQIGNFSTNNSGIQIGSLNTGGSLQLGLLNYNSRSYIPWLPFVNWDMGREEK